MCFHLSVGSPHVLILAFTPQVPSPGAGTSCAVVLALACHGSHVVIDLLHAPNPVVACCVSTSQQ